MRMLNPSLAVASLLGFLTAASCTLITDVDRTKIPTDAGPGTGGTSAGDTGMAGTGNEGGTGATGGSGTGGRGGRGGNGGTAGMEAGAGGNDAGSGGSSTPSKVCAQATGRITIGVGTLIDATGSTFTLSDGVNDKVTFEFDWDGDSTTVTGSNVIPFSGTPTTAELAVLIALAINDAADLDITASTSAEGPPVGAGGAGGEGGIGAGGANGAGAGAGGQGGSGDVPAEQTETVELTNDRSGARGNVKITETVGNPNFKVTGMSGGSAVLCDTATACSDDSECDDARTCGTDHVCE